MQEQGQFNMTQALNLANFANNLNTAGATSNSGLQNSSVTVTAGTGMSGGGAVALGSSVTLTNAGVTSVAAGTGISVSGSTGGVTITNSQPFSGSTSQLAKAWVNFAGSTGTINSSFNVSSVTRNSTGYYTVNMTTAMPNINYVTNVSISPTGATIPVVFVYSNPTITTSVIAPTTTTFSFSAANSAQTTAADPTYCMASVFSS